MAHRLHGVADELLSLADWRRRVAELYSRIRADPEPRHAWEVWKNERDMLFGSHPQSPIPADRRDDFTGITYFDHDPSFRVVGTVEDALPKRYNNPSCSYDPQWLCPLAPPENRIEASITAGERKG